MKKLIKKMIMTAFAILLVFGLSGCEKRQAPEEYLESEIQKLKSGKSDLYEQILLDELTLNDVEDFPDELTDGYLAFLKEAYANMRFEVTEAEDKGKNQYRAIVSVEPLDLEATILNITREYLADMQSADLVTEVKAVMALNQTELPHAVYTDKIDIPVRMDWEDKNYTINAADFLALANAAVADKLAPYQMVEEVFDIQKYVQACLDADFKGEFDEYILQSGLSREEAEAQRNESLWDTELESELNFTEEEAGQFTAALNDFLGAASYEVGIPRKAGENHYTVEISYRPNLSLKKCTDEVLASVNSGNISSIEALKQAYLTAMATYAAAPEYGGDASVTVNIMPGEDNQLQITEEDIDTLYDAILPSE